MSTIENGELVKAETFDSIVRAFDVPAELVGTPDYLTAAGREVHRLRARVRQLDAELVRLTAGADDTPKPPECKPTAGQMWHTLLEADEESRLMMLDTFLGGVDQAARCFTEDHERTIENLRDCL